MAKSNARTCRGIGEDRQARRGPVAQSLRRKRPGNSTKKRTPVHLNSLLRRLGVGRIFASAVHPHYFRFFLNAATPARMIASARFGPPRLLTLNFFPRCLL